MKHKSGTLSKTSFIDREAREIIRLVASVRPSIRLFVCLSVYALTSLTRSGRYLGSACRVQQKHHDARKIPMTHGVQSKISVCLLVIRKRSWSKAVRSGRGGGLLFYVVILRWMCRVNINLQWCDLMCKDFDESSDVVYIYAILVIFIQDLFLCVANFLTSLDFPFALRKMACHQNLTSEFLDTHCINSCLVVRDGSTYFHNVQAPVHRSSGTLVITSRAILVNCIVFETIC